MPGPNHRCDRCLAWHKVDADSAAFPYGLGMCCLNPPHPQNETLASGLNFWAETTGDMGCLSGFISKFADRQEDEGGRRYG